MNPVTILFRRILYKIPLKRLLVLLAVFAIGFAYTNAFDLTFISSGTVSLTPPVPVKTVGVRGELVCASTPNSAGFYFSGEKVNQYNVVCGISPVVLSGQATVRTVIYNVTCPSCPSQYTSQECQTEYNLIPISSVDQNYCETNNLCQVCPDIPEFTGTLSNLYINDIFHLGAPVIQMNIPEEIDWDYAYTNSGFNMNIDVVGYNQDSEYINNLIDVQTYQPTSEDFTNVFLGFREYAGLLVVTLFIILLFYFVKKSFK